MRSRTKTLMVYGHNEDIAPRIKSHLETGWEVDDLKRTSKRAIKVSLRRVVNYP